jgi:uncharacterized protein involved in oxidation of intracellular sulfur
MTSTLFVLNDAPYGNERAFNGLRLAGALAAKEDQAVRLFLMADAVGCAKSGQKVPEGYYNVQIMLGKVARKSEIGLCGTCMDARGLRDEEMIDGARRGTLADWTAEADKVLVF